MPPESSVRFKTLEFDVVVHANRFGFRGDEFHYPHWPNCWRLEISSPLAGGTTLSDTWEKVLVQKTC